MALSRVPGQVRPVGHLEHEHNRRTSDLSNKSLLELKDMLRRQEHMLANKRLIGSLKDKGQKIRLRRDELSKLVEEREKEVDAATDLLTQLSIGGQKTTVEEMEFKYGGPRKDINRISAFRVNESEMRADLDSDDDDNGDEQSIDGDEASTKDSNSSKNHDDKQIVGKSKDNFDEASKSSALSLEKHALMLSERSRLSSAPERFIPCHVSDQVSTDGVAETSGLVRRAHKDRLKPSELMPLEEEMRACKTKMLTLEESMELEFKHRLAENSGGNFPSPLPVVERDANAIRSDEEHGREFLPVDLQQELNEVGGDGEKSCEH